MVEHNRAGGQICVTYVFNAGHITSAESSAILPDYETMNREVKKYGNSYICCYDS